MLDNQHIAVASRCLSEGNMDAAIEACNRVLELDADNVMAELVRSEALLRSGYMERAIEGAARVLAIDRGNVQAQSLFERGITARRSRNARLASIDRVAGETVVRCLGIGREGAVYLTRGQNGHLHVAKVFHPHMVRESRTNAHNWQDTLPRIATYLKEQPEDAVDTLYRFDVLARDGALHGIIYDYEQLIPVRKRHLALSDVAPAIMGAFFRTQACLCAHVGACLTDAHVANFMMARDGLLRFIDYGKESFTNPASSDEDSRPELSALIRLVYQLFKGIQLNPHLPCSFAACAGRARGLADLAKNREWLQRVLASVDAGTDGDFLDAGYYAELARNLPRRIGFTSRTIIYLSNTIGSAWRSMPKPSMTQHTRRAGGSSTVVETIHS